MNNESNEKEIIKKNVLEKIVSDQIKMRPRFHFMIKAIGLFLILALVVLVSSLLISYILFTLKVSGQLFLLGFGLKGIQSFIILFPWFFLLLDCILIVVLEWFLKKFSFAYHSPLLYLLIFSFGAVIIIGYAINLTSFHGNLFKMNREGQLWIFGSLYEDLDDLEREDGVFCGTVIGINGNTILVRQTRPGANGEFGVEEIVLTDAVNMSKPIYLGERIFVAGDRINDRIHAYGIREIMAR